jgi:hypothetical protein
MSAEELRIRCVMARGIAPDSWLNEERFAEFRAGYSYASGQTRAITALSETSPEDLFFAWSAINRGIDWHRRENESVSPSGGTQA